MSKVQSPKSKVETHRYVARERALSGERESAGKPDALQTLRDEPRQGKQTRASVWSASGLPALSRAILTGVASVIMVVLIATGCTTPMRPPTSTPHPQGTFPTNGLITQRATLTVRGRQFALTGYVALDATRGRRLIVTELFGHVLADVLVKPDGAVFVMRSSPMLRPDWIRRYLAADLQCIFGGAPEAGCPVRMLEENHFLIERRWYKLDLRTVETRSGPQSTEMFDETRAEKP